MARSRVPITKGFDGWPRDRAPAAAGRGAVAGKGGGKGGGSAAPALTGTGMNDIFSYLMSSKKD